MGESLCGSAPLDGDLVNLQFVQGFGGNISFEHIDPVGDPPTYIWTVNGRISEISPNTSFSFFAPDEVYTVNVHKKRPEQRYYPDYNFDFFGNRVYLRWDQSTSTDVVAYGIYIGSTLQDTISKITVSEKLYVTNTSGTGTGRVSIVGEWLGGIENKSYTITIGAANTFECDLAPGITFSIGANTHLGNGVYVRFCDSYNDYHNGDTYVFFVGPLTYWQSGPKEDGTYTYTIKAIDAAGNISSGIDQVVTINRRPYPIHNLAVSWDGDEFTISWDQDPDPKIVGYKIYSNYSHVYNKLTDTVDVVLTDIADDKATSYTFGPSVHGDWMFRVVGYDDARRESDSIEMVKFNSLNAPSDILLDNPSQVVLTPTIAGSFQASWYYDYDEGPDITHFRIYIANTEAELITLLEDETPTTIVATAGSGIQQITRSIAGNGNVNRWFAVRSSNGNYHSINDDRYMVVTDAVAPNNPADADGGPS
jgi:hypothetical protein